MKPGLLFLSALLLSASLAGAQQLKIATFDFQKAFSEYYKTKDAEAELQARVATFKKEDQERTNDYRKIAEEAQKLQDGAQDKTLSEAARQERLKAFQAKVQEVQNLQRAIQEFRTTRGRELEERSQRIRQGLIDEITKIVVDVGAKDKYTLVIDKTGRSLNGTPVLLYSQDLPDITEEVVRAINATKGAAPKAASAHP
ncbi:OmpH family outer membrane protein [Methylacidimicrobium sp. B4]|uniref:OmpH family outer membrane protein n=1 Tax=Methylacidimicrobium sp. B4 TaxID=2796139 RepID=UPI001F5C6775|nr:OmpH family outer membrane protein [Methylacidimicrobium sp. B4]